MSINDLLPDGQDRFLGMISYLVLASPAAKDTARFPPSASIETGCPAQAFRFRGFHRPEHPKGSVSFATGEKKVHLLADMLEGPEVPPHRCHPRGKRPTVVSNKQHGFQS